MIPARDGDHRRVVILSPFNEAAALCFEDGGLFFLLPRSGGYFPLGLVSVAVVPVD